MVYTVEHYILIKEFQFFFIRNQYIVVVVETFPLNQQYFDISTFKDQMKFTPNIILTHSPYSMPPQNI